MVQIIHIEGERQGEVDDLNQNTITIGRHPACDVKFPPDSLYIARRHAKITYIDGKYIFTNYGVNGSAVNGVKVKSTVLQNGDVITFADGGPKVSFLNRQSHGKKATTGPTSAITSLATNERGNLKNHPKREAAMIPAADIADETGEFTLQYGGHIRSFHKFSVTLGRNPQNDFQIVHPALSEHHATLFFLNKNYYIKDLHSAPIILVNRHISSPDRKLQSGDIISFTSSGPELCYRGEGKFVEHEFQDK